MEMTLEEQAQALGFTEEVTGEFSSYRIWTRTDEGRLWFLTYGTDEQLWRASWTDPIARAFDDRSAGSDGMYIAPTAAAAYMLGALNEWK